MSLLAVAYNPVVCYCRQLCFTICTCSP